MFENGQLTVLNINDILPNRFQPRIRFDEEKLEELAESIGKYGVIQPIVVRPVSNKYEIIAGERRYKASKLANKSTIPAIIVNLSDKDSEEIALLENIQRQQLSPIEEAVSYKRILDMGYITQEQLAKKLGKSQSTIANKIRLLNLDDEVQSYLLNNKISERHARSLLRIPDKEKQVAMLHRIVEERLTVKQTDKEIEKLREETKIENRAAKPETIVVPKSVQEVSKPVEVKTNNTPEEIESLFDEAEDIKQEERGSNNMDIEKIMREAKDINAPQQEEPKDISGLMQPGNDVQSEPIVREEPVSNNVNLEPNKFINVAPQQEEVKPVQTAPANNGVTFDSMFNQHISTPDTTATVNQSSAQPEPQQSQPQTVTSIPEMPAPTVPVQEMPTPAINSEVNVTSSVQPQTSVQDEVSDDTKKVISTAVADALKRYNENKAQQKISEVQPINPVNNVQTPVQSTPVQPVQAEQPMVSSSVAEPLSQPAPVSSQPMSDIPEVVVPSEPSIPNSDIIADSTLNEYAIPNANQGVEQSTMASAMTQDVKPVNNQAHFAQIVKLLRDCADQIEQNGYYVNVDEMDLGNQYKVTFTINKE